MPTPSSLFKVGDRCKILKTRSNPPPWFKSVAVVAEIAEDGKTIRAEIVDQPGLRYSFQPGWLERLPTQDQQAGPQETPEGSNESDKPVEAPTSEAPAAKPSVPVNEPYLFSQCTITVGIQLLPDDGSGDRPVIIGVRNHTDAPILKLVRQSQLGELPPVVSELLQVLKTDLPRRAEAQKNKHKRPAAKSSPKPTPEKTTAVSNPTPTTELIKEKSQAQMSLFDALNPGV